MARRISGGQPPDNITAAMRAASEGVARAIARPKSRPVDLGYKQWGKKGKKPTGENGAVAPD